ncbi:CLUMA_CG015051, isoform A, partial [Clunio marinus]
FLIPDCAARQDYDDYDDFDPDFDHSTTLRPTNLLPCTYEGKIYKDYEIVYRQYNENKRLCEGYQCLNGSVDPWSRDCFFYDRIKRPEEVRKCKHVFEDGECSPQLDCSCEYEGKTYRHGSYISKEPINVASCLEKFCIFNEISERYQQCPDYVAMMSPEDLSRCKLYYPEGECCPVLDCETEESGRRKICQKYFDY